MDARTLKQKSKVTLLYYGCRPKTLFASAFPVILGMLLAKFHGHYDIIIYLETLFAAILLQIAANYANDYLDHKDKWDTSERLGPPRLSSLNLISKKESLLILSLTIFSAILLTIPLIIHGGKLILYLLFLGVFTVFFYSYGKYSLANTGLANLVVFFVFGPLATFTTYYLQTHIYSTEAALLGAIPGCLSIMLFTINNMRDIAEDKKGGKKTLIVRFGFIWGKIEYITALIISLLVPPIFVIYYNIPAITILPLFLLPKSMELAIKVIKTSSPKDIVPLFEKTAKYSILYALLYTIGWRIAFI